MLLLLLAAGTALLILVGEMLAPVLAALVIAYLLDQVIALLGRRGCPRRVGVGLIFAGFMGTLLLTVFWLIPLIGQQLSTLFTELPNMLTRGQETLMALPARYPRFVSEAQLNELVVRAQGEAAALGQTVLSYSLTSLMGLATVLVYLFIVPFLVFFFLKDRDLLKSWVVGRLPKERNLARRVWREVREQIGNYVRGKVLEMVIVGFVTYIAFAVFDLRFALLLSVLVGISVLIPYIGVVVATVPVMLVGYFQWGFSTEFGSLLLIYSVIQAIDGVILVPLLFSEAVKLHPVAIIIAILFFGGVWGFWGVFFAIPLATLVKAVLNAWSSEPPPANPHVEILT